MQVFNFSLVIKKGVMERFYRICFVGDTIAVGVPGKTMMTKHMGITKIYKKNQRLTGQL